MGRHAGCAFAQSSGKCPLYRTVGAGRYARTHAHARAPRSPPAFWCVFGALFGVSGASARRRPAPPPRSEIMRFHNSARRTPRRAAPWAVPSQRPPLRVRGSPPDAGPRPACCHVCPRFHAGPCYRAGQGQGERPADSPPARPSFVRAPVPCVRCRGRALRPHGLRARPRPRPRVSWCACAPRARCLPSCRPCLGAVWHLPS